MSLTNRASRARLYPHGTPVSLCKVACDVVAWLQSGSHLRQANPFRYWSWDGLVFFGNKRAIQNFSCPLATAAAVCAFMGLVHSYTLYLLPSLGSSYSLVSLEIYIKDLHV